MDKVKYEYNFQVVATCPKCKAMMVLDFAKDMKIRGQVIKCSECGNTYELAGHFD